MRLLKLNLSFVNEKTKFLCLTLLLLVCISQSSISQNILINEFMASNDNSIADEFGENDDWVELYNPSTSPVNIGGMYLTDDLSEPTLWQIPDNASQSTTIPANGYLILWLDKETDQGPLHINAKLSSSGEDLAIFASDGTTLVDSRTFGVQYADVSEGRTPNGGTSWDYYPEATPNAANDTDPGLAKADAPTASLNSGFHDDTITVSLSSIYADAKIHYTTGGAIPTLFSPEYVGPLSIAENTSLRAVVFVDGLTASEPATFNYLLEESPTFPVMNIVAGDDLLFSPSIGLYPNYTQDIEIPAHVELIEPDGTVGFSQIAEIEIHGSASATLPQKSIAIKAKKSLGGKEFDYPVFDDLPFDAYRSLIVRNSGQDHNITMFRDALVSSLVRDLSDVNGIITPPNLYTQGYRPGVVYINGEYWGIHNIRERMDKRYLKVHFDLDEEDVDLLENWDEVKEGDLNEWTDFVGFLTANEFSNDADFEELKTRIDTDHFLDYIVFNVYVDNWDWPANNNKRWRERTAGAKWRYMTWDLDFTFGLYSPQGWNSGAWFNNSLSRLFNENGNGWPNASWSTLPFRKMIANKKWRTQLVNRMADQINVLYDADRINGRIDEFQATYAPEMPVHIERWTNGFLNWDYNINILKTFATNRASSVRQHVVATFPDVYGTAEVTLSANPSNGGVVKWSTITAGQNQFPWRGIYFTGMDIPVEAVPNPGFVFTGWSVGSMGSDATTSVMLDSSMAVTANFSPIGNQQAQTIAFANIPDLLTTDTSFQISASASSGLPVSFNISGPATLSGDTISLNGSVGTVTVIASQNGNSTFLPAANVTRVFNVTNPIQGGNPTVELTTPSPIVNGSFTVSIQFDESVNDLTLAEVQVTNGTKSNAAGGGASYSFTVTPIAYGNIEIVIPAGSAFDSDGNPNVVSNTLQVNFPNPNSSNPIAILSTPTTNVNGAFPVNIEFDKSVNDLTLAEIQVTNGTKSNAAGGGASYSFTVTPDTIGLVSIVVPAGSAFDNDGNPNLVSNTLQVTYQNSSTNNCNNAQNLALQKPTAQSGTQQSGDASRAVDGNTDGDAWGGNSVAITNWQQQPWWQVDLGTSQTIDEIRIWNREDCCMENLQNYHVLISNNAFTSDELDATLNQSGVTSFFQNDIASRATTIPINQTGRYVRIQMASAGFMSLAEVEVLNCNNTSTTIQPTDYCESYGQLQTQEWIETVGFHDLFNGSGNDDGYGDYTNLSTTLQAGSTYSIVLNPGFLNSIHQEYWNIWIDFNQDGDFEDGNELVFSNNGIGVIIGDVQIPQAVDNGETRMRVSMKWNSSAGSCSIFGFGEVEDYTVDLTGGTGALIGFFPNQNLIPADEKGLQVSAYPNPIEQILVVDYSTLKTGTLETTLLNLHGVVIFQKEQEVLAGEDRLYIDMSKFPAGVYTLFLKQGGHQKAVKVIKVID